MKSNHELSELNNDIYKEVKKLVYNIYKKDFELFGYHE